MLSADMTDSEREGSDQSQQGVYGWLMFFVIVFFLNSFNILSIPVTASWMPWGDLLRESPAATIHLMASSGIEFLSAIACLTAAILILQRRKAARAVVYFYCLLEATAAVAGLIMVNATAELFRHGNLLTYFLGGEQYLTALIRIPWGGLIYASLISAYVGIIAVAAVIFLYFRLSERVRVTLIR